MFADTADSPFSLGAVREEHGIGFDLVSHMSRDAIRAYDLEIDIGDLGLHGVARRLRPRWGGTVTYGWVAENPTSEPEYDAVLEAVE